jgi:hypothetical protein
MPCYRITGEVPPKRHTQYKGPGGRLPHEELMGEEGFSSDSYAPHRRQLEPGHHAADADQFAELIMGALRN